MVVDVVRERLLGPSAPRLPSLRAVDPGKPDPFLHIPRKQQYQPIAIDEDASRIRKGHAPAIMTTIRRLAMNRFEPEASKLRLSQKRRNAAWNDHYRAKVVFG